MGANRIVPYDLFASFYEHRVPHENLFELMIYQFPFAINMLLLMMYLCQDRKTMTTRDVKGFYFFLWPEIGQFLIFLTKLHRKSGEKGKIHWRKYKEIQWRWRPEIADYCPERVLTMHLFLLKNLVLKFESLLSIYLFVRGDSTNWNTCFSTFQKTAHVSRGVSAGLGWFGAGFAVLSAGFAILWEREKRLKLSGNPLRAVLWNMPIHVLSGNFCLWSAYSTNSEERFEVPTYSGPCWGVVC